MTMVFEDANVANLRVAHMGTITLLQSLEDQAGVIKLEPGEVITVARRFDQHFMKAGGRPNIKNGSFNARVILGAEKRKFIGYHAYQPAGVVGVAIGGPMGKGFGGRESLMAQTERTIFLVIKSG